MRLADYLQGKGYSHQQMNTMIGQGKILILLAGSKSQTLVEGDIDIGYGDKIYVATNHGVKCYHHRASSKSGEKSRKKGSEVPDFPSLVAGTIGFVLGGPISAFLSYICAHTLLARQSESGTSHNTGNVSFELVFHWMVIGSLAMPTSWWIANRFGWNLDVLAFFQSQGKHRSYRDWSKADSIEEDKRVALLKAQQEAIRAKDEERKRREKVAEAARLADQDRIKRDTEKNHQGQLRSITLALIELDRNPDKFSNGNLTCSKATDLMSRIEKLRDDRGVVDFNFWTYKSDLQALSDADWNGGRRESGYIVDGAINAFEVLQTINDYIKTCEAIRYIQ